MSKAFDDCIKSMQGMVRKIDSRLTPADPDAPKAPPPEPPKSKVTDHSLEMQRMRLWAGIDDIEDYKTEK